MRKFTSLFLAALFLTAACLVGIAPRSAGAAEIQTARPFTNLSSALSATTTSSVTDTGLYFRKTVCVTGKLSNSAFGNYSGTFTGQCGMAQAGPFFTAKDVNGNAVTATTNTCFHLDDMCHFFRATYTRGAAHGSKKLDAWLLYGQ